MPRFYKCLSQQISKSGKYSLIPIRDEDKYEIMRWRNEQLYHLRQSELLTKEQQNWYFENIISSLFAKENPDQILFSYLENDVCIGYGGLVHINWLDKNAEISFIIKTELEKDYFDYHWKTYLSLLENVAFRNLKLHKIFTYAFDLRPQLYNALEKAKFTEEARLKEHCLWEKNFYDVVIHAKYNKNIYVRKATIDDLGLYFNWANDDDVREQSFNTSKIEFEDHKGWFENRIKDRDCFMLILENDNNLPIGQVRFQNHRQNHKSVISISIDKKYRGLGYAPKMLEQACDLFFQTFPGFTIEAYIKETNKASVNSFVNTGFQYSKSLEHHGSNSVLYIKSK